jgi:multicomponent Na+:H+ antiporter subunit D
MIPGAGVIPLFVAIPLAAAFAIVVAARLVRNLPEILAVCATGSLLVLALLCVLRVNAVGATVYSVGGWSPPVGISLVLDGLSALIVVTINLVAFFAALYSVRYVQRYAGTWLYYALFLLMLAGMNGVAITGDIFNLYVFLEIAAVASYALVAFGVERHELEAAFKYAVLGTLGSLFILLGIALLYAWTSTLNMADMAHVLKTGDRSHVVTLATLLFLAGFGIKAALVPFHAWLPDAHPSAPAPISAMLSGVLIKTLGIYALCRILFNVIGMDERLSAVLMLLGSLSMIVGVLLALAQWDIKRLLAYHSISQVGYIIFSIGLGTPLGILAGLFHLFNHALFKSLLFLDAGAVEQATGTRDLHEMGGLAKKMPVTGVSTLAGAMSLAGVPPFNGFWSKLLIVIAAVQAGRYGYAFVAVLASIITLASVLKVLRYGFSGSVGSGLERVREAPVAMAVVMAAMAFLCLVGGLLLVPGVSAPFLQAATDVLVRGTENAAIVLTEVPR